MKQSTLYLLTRTPLHVGSGSSVGAIDLPVQRERHTHLPVIPGSAIKGVLADGEGYLEMSDTNSLRRSEKGSDIFGTADPGAEDSKSGSISFGEAKLLAFPVRSGKGCFAWVTSPMLLSRWARDTHAQALDIPKLEAGHCLAPSALVADDSVLLEEFVLSRQAELPAGLVDALTPLLGQADTYWKQSLADHLVVASDDDLTHFARNCCEVAQHVKINDDTGTATGGALFNQENVPADTLFYANLFELRENRLAELQVAPVIQVGGSATTGLGFCTANLQEVSQ